VLPLAAVKGSDIDLLNLSSVLKEIPLVLEELLFEKPQGALI
jgi:hypothetical protein